MLIAVIVVVIIGALMSLVINYLSDVLPYTRKISAASCKKCNHVFKWNEYLFSFKCPECKTRPPLRNFIVLISSIAGSVCAALFPIQGLSYWTVVLLLTFLGLIMVIDIEHKAVLHETSIVGAVLMLVLGISMNGIWMTLLGGAAGYGFMLLLYYGGGLFAKFLGKLRHQEIDEIALGFGDVNVTGFLGLLVGWPDVISLLIFAILLGGVISIFFILIMSALKKYQALTAIPYAPFLVISAILILFFR